MQQETYPPLLEGWRGNAASALGQLKALSAWQKSLNQKTRLSLALVIIASLVMMLWMKYTSLWMFITHVVVWTLIGVLVFNIIPYFHPKPPVIDDWRKYVEYRNRMAKILDENPLLLERKCSATVGALVHERLGHPRHRQTIFVAGKSILLEDDGQVEKAQLRECAYEFRLCAKPTKSR